MIARNSKAIFKVYLERCLGRAGSGPSDPSFPRFFSLVHRLTLRGGGVGVGPVCDPRLEHDGRPSTQMN